jgi:hypothetical protein
MATIAELKAYFETGKFPTQSQFAELIDFFGDVQTVVNNIGSKLFHRPTIAYPADSVVLTTAGIWYCEDPVAAGAFDENDWSLLFSFTIEPNVSALGIPSYDPEKNDYVSGNQVTWKNKIYQAIDAGPFGGIEPGVDPDTESYWELVIYTEGGIIPVLPSGGFVKFGTVYEYTGSAAAKGLYRCNYVAPGFDAGFKTSNFATELAASKWLLVAIKESSGGSSGPAAYSVQSAAPTVDSDADAGYSVGYLIYSTTTGLTYECIDSTNGAAVWRPTSGNLSADTDFLDKFIPDGLGVTDITVNSYYYSKIGKVVNITVVGALEYTDGNDGSFQIPIPPGYTLDELYYGYSLIFRIPEFQQSLQGEVFIDKVDAETLFLQFNSTQTLTVDFTLLITIWVAE